MNEPKRGPGRPPIAESVSQLPACTVPSYVHDAVIKESLQRDVSVAQVVRESLIDHLKNTAQSQTASF